MIGMEVYVAQISSYFNQIVNQIDAKAVELTSKHLYKEHLLMKINETCANFVQEIRAVEHFNLENLERNAFTLSDGLKSEHLLKNVCFFVDNFEPDTPIGYLIIVDGYVSEDEISLCKEIMKSFNEQIELSGKNPFFNIKPGQVSFEIFKFSCS
jgi:hypothetical protein